ncbi:MAG TPA: tetratricopeptide repeat protein [Thermoanaerobaculia bacterium]|nr:tetratricopeptide repeat protein [Thermoanaerobaculia bacterium]
MRARWWLIASLAVAGGAQVAGQEAAPSRRPQLAPLEEPALERQEPAVRRQLGEARRRLDQLLASDAATDRELGEAFGRLGRLYFLYDIVDLTIPALHNAQLLAPDDYRWPYFIAVHQTFEGDLENAERNLRRVLELQPDDAPTLVRLANVLLDQGRAAEAEPLYRTVAELEPQRAAALAGLARIAQERGEHERAIELAEQALALQPRADSLYHLAGMSHRALGDREAARAALERNKHGRVLFADPLVDALGAENASVEAHFQAASEAMRRSDFEGAVRFYQSYLRAKGEDASTLHNLGIALLSLDRWDEALATLRRAVELDPRSRAASFSLGSALADLGRHEEALPFYQRAHELDPAEKVIHADWATLLAKVGEVPRALAELEGILAEDPLQYYARLKYGTVLTLAGRFDEAWSQLRQVADSGGLGPPSRAEAHVYLARLAARRGESDAARDHLEQAVGLDPRSPEAQLAWGEELARQGLFDQAAEALREAVGRDPQDERAHFSLAMALLLGKRYAAAVGALEEALRALPENVPLRHLLARVLATSPDAEARNAARALELAQQVVAQRLTLDHVETLAMAFAESGQWEEAAATQRQVITHAERLGSASGAAHQQRLERLARYQRRETVRAPWEG